MSIRNDILSNLLDALQVIKHSTDYPAEIRSIKPYHENMLTKLKGEMPVLTAIDQGNEQISSEDTTHWRFAFDVDVEGALVGDSSLDTQRKLNDILSSLQRFANSTPNLGSAVHALEYVEGLPHLYNKEDGHAKTGARFRIHYVREKPNSEAAGNDVYGTGFIDTAIDKIVAQLNTLKTTIATYDPKFSSVYRRHNVANLVLNAVTVGVDSIAPESEAIGSSGLTVEYPCPITVRVHTGYLDGLVDSEATIRLLTGIGNYLQEHKDLGDSYRLLGIQEMAVNEVFEESASTGGYLIAVVNMYQRHTQG